MQCKNEPPLDISACKLLIKKIDTALRNKILRYFSVLILSEFDLIITTESGDERTLREPLLSVVVLVRLTSFSRGFGNLHVAAFCSNMSSCSCIYQPGCWGSIACISTSQRPGPPLIHTVPVSQMLMMLEPPPPPPPPTCISSIRHAKSTPTFTSPII